MARSPTPRSPFHSPKFLLLSAIALPRETILALDQKGEHSLPRTSRPRAGEEVRVLSLSNTGLL